MDENQENDSGVDELNSEEYEFEFGNITDDEDCDFEPVEEYKEESEEYVNDRQDESSEIELEPEGVEVEVEGINLGKQQKNKRVGITNKDREKRRQIHVAHLISLVACCLILNDVANNVGFQREVMKSISRSNKDRELESKLREIAKIGETQFGIVDYQNVEHTIRKVFSSVENWMNALIYKKKRKSTFMDGGGMEKEKEYMKQILGRQDGNMAGYIRKQIIIGGIFRACGIRTRICFGISPVPLQVRINELVEGAPKKEPSRVIGNVWIEIIYKDEWVILSPNSGKITNPNVYNVEFRNKQMHSTGGIVVNKDSGEGETKNFDAIIPYLVAVDNGGGVKELRKKYFIKSMQRLEKYRVRDEEIGEILGATATVKDARHEIKNENEEKIAHINEQSRIQSNIYNQKLPTRATDFINHKIFALGRYLKQNQEFKDGAACLGYFKGEKIYSRDDVEDLYSAYEWKKRGQQVKTNERARKTILRKTNGSSSFSSGGFYGGNKRNFEGMLVNEGNSDVREIELFAEWQTEAYKPRELDMGAMGNKRKVEILHSNMIPHNAVHLKLEKIKETAKRLKIKYLDVVIGYEYKHSVGRSVPIVEGILILKEDEEMLLREYSLE